MLGSEIDVRNRNNNNNHHQTNGNIFGINRRGCYDPYHHSNGLKLKDDKNKMNHILEIFFIPKKRSIWLEECNEKRMIRKKEKLVWLV